MADLDGLIDRLETSPDPRSLLRPLRSAPGLCDAYVRRILAHFADEPARALALARHWRVVRDLGDDPALAYRAKGIALKLEARWLASAEAFVRSGELAQAEVERLSYQVGAIDGFSRAGRVDQAVALGRQIADGLDALARPGLAARARLNAANALLWAERNREARALFADASGVFRREGMAMEEAASRLGLSTTHLFGGDPSAARDEAAAALALAEQEGLEHLQVLCRINLAQYELVQGRPDEAFARLLALRDSLDEVPAERVRVMIYLGEACVRLNLFHEAIEAFEAVLALGDTVPRTDQADALMGLGEAHREDERAVGHLRDAEARFRRLGNRPWRAAALAARISRQPSRREALRLASLAIDEAEGSPFHETLAFLARAEALAARGRSAEEELRRAHRHVRRYGFRRFAWRIHALRALPAARPLPSYRRMLAEIVRDRLATSSVAARAGFLEDKTAALGGYLSALLAAPTPPRVAEAREVIRRTRAATLLDEIVRSGGEGLDERRLLRLEELRAQVRQDAMEDARNEARLADGAAVPSRRAWIEATHVLGELDAVLPPAPTEGCVLLAEAQGQLWALADARAFRLPLSLRELDESLRWIYFELQAPTVRRDACPNDVCAMLSELRQALVSPWLHEVSVPFRLCPDGLLWRVPWGALLPPEIPLALHPSLSGNPQAGSIDRVAVWVDAPADLPNAHFEERAVLTRFPRARVLRTRVEALDSLKESWDLIHVIGHARHNAENPMFSALQFSDGPVFAYEIARSGLRARLACLSACETGTLSHATRAEPDGLVRAFLARGAESVFASLWPLDDEAASIFFAKFYADLTPRGDLPRTFEAARNAVRQWRSHPYFWASLTHFSGHRS